MRNLVINIGNLIFRFLTQYQNFPSQRNCVIIIINYTQNITNQFKVQNIQIEMVNCPIKQCGRKFENEETMLQHVRRRHPNQYNSIKQDLTKSIIEKQHIQQQQLSKLPKLAKLMSREKKGTQIPVKSNSKGKSFQGGSANLSSIIQQSRQLTASHKSSIAARKPSLNKKISSSDLKKQTKVDKLPPLQKQLKKSDIVQVQKKRSLNSIQSTQQFYTTVPNFKTVSNTVLKSRSKSKKKSIQKKPSQQRQAQKQKQSFTEPANFRNTMINLTDQKHSLQLGVDKKKNLLRPTKKIQKKQSDKVIRTQSTQMSQKPDFEQKIVNITSWPQKTFNCPNSNIQMLFVNNCNLHNVILNSLQSLIELSLNGNKLRDMQFLRYQKNYNIKIIHIDHNELTQIYTPPKLKILTASFNNLKSESILQVCSVLKKSADLQQIDFSFNNIRKAQNYKLKIIGVCERIKKIDGLKVTKIDRDMYEELIILESKHKGLIPLGSPSNQRPTTAVSQYYTEPFNPSEQISQVSNLYSVKTIAQLQSQQAQYQRLISQTQKQLKVIKQQNQIIEQELSAIKSETKEIEQSGSNAMLSLLSKLQKQCQFLQLLNVMQYADEEELAGMISKKKLDLGITCQ